MSPMSSIKPKDYQQQIIDQLAVQKSRALFMGTGSGKTYTSLFIHKTLNADNLLVICPATITMQWRESIKEVLPDYKIFDIKKSYTGKRINEELKNIKGKNNAIVVSMYVIHSLKRLEDILDPKWHIIFDESHRMKSHTTRVTKTALRLGRYTNNKTILTATPTEADFGGFIDLYTQLTFLGQIKMTRNEFLDRYTFQKPMYLPHLRFPIMEITGYRPEIVDIENLLKAISRSYTPTYTDEPAQSFKIDIPRAPKYANMKYQRFYKEMDFSNPTRMRIAERTITTGTITGKDMYGERLNYSDNTLKIDWLSDFIQDQATPVLVYYQYNVELAQLEEMAKKLNKKYIVINGANNNKLEDIKEKEYDLILGQLDACSESIDGLQHKTNIAVYFALPESSIVARQSTGRLDRMGQKLSPRFYYLIMDKTVDAHIWKLVQSKKNYSQETLDKLVLDQKR